MPFVPPFFHFPLPASRVSSLNSLLTLRGLRWIEGGQRKQTHTPQISQTDTHTRSHRQTHTHQISQTDTQSGRDTHTRSHRQTPNQGETHTPDLTDRHPIRERHTHQISQTDRHPIRERDTHLTDGIRSSLTHHHVLRYRPQT